MTGAELYKYTQTLIDKDYSSYLDNVKANRLFLASLDNVIEATYRTLSTQEMYDDLSSLIKTEKVYSINNNQIGVTPVAIKSIFPSLGLLTIETYQDHNLIVGDSLKISGVTDLTTTPAINSTRVVTAVLTSRIFKVANTTFTGAYVSQTGVVTHNKMIVDYAHQLAVSATIEEKFVKAKILDLTNTNPIVLKFSVNTAIRSGNMVRITNALGNTAANGTYYVKALSLKNFELYQDEALSISVLGNGIYIDGSATIYRVYSNYCTPYVSDRKISVFGVPTPTNPKVEDAQGFLKFYPSGLTCSSIKMDYIAKPEYLIDVADNVFDLEKVYPLSFLYNVANNFVKIFSMTTRDESLMQMANVQQIQNNP